MPTLHDKNQNTSL